MIRASTWTNCKRPLALTSSSYISSNPFSKRNGAIANRLHTKSIVNKFRNPIINIGKAGDLVKKSSSIHTYNFTPGTRGNEMPSLRSGPKVTCTGIVRATALLALSATTSVLGFSSSSNMNQNMSSTTTTTTTTSLASSSSSASADMTTTSTSQSHPLIKLSSNFDHSWVSQLSPETPSNRLKSQQRSPSDDGTSNNVKRPVYNGHYVPVKPSPLNNPRLVIHSPEMAQRLSLTPQDVQSTQFAQFFSGDVDAALSNSETSTTATWATPYALSIMGKRYTSNCPYGTGDGYGDGRAISIGEVQVSPDYAHTTRAAPRYELQLKGAGPTPFCRGADGRAVLRSSIREFLASEAMFYLGIETTRALSLVVSEDGEDGPGNTSTRPWYSDTNVKNLPSMDDPRLARYTLEQRKQIIAQLNAQTKNDPDIAIEEPNAITCRVAASFVRIGHFDLFARRAMKHLVDETQVPDKTKPEFKELEELLWHACFREYPNECYHPFHDSGDILSASKVLLEHSMEGIATMVAEWIRVGFAQGNFNADNCLVAGRTMDYGPFGFMDEYHPLFAKWTGSGEHFGFMNQPNAGYANFAMLVDSVMTIVEAYMDDRDKAKQLQEEIMVKGQTVFEEKINAVFRKKLGFHEEDETADEIWTNLEALLRETKTDWTVFWRQLTYVAKEFPISTTDVDTTSTAYGDMLELLHANDEVKAGSSPFYEPLDVESRAKFLKWIQTWREALVESYQEGGISVILAQNDDSIGDTNAMSPYERMHRSNPKYTLREWMLVEAYSKASTSTIHSNIFTPIVNTQTRKGDESEIHNLFELIQNPYDEGTDEQDEKYYRRAPDQALKAGGTAFMS